MEGGHSMMYTIFLAYACSNDGDNVNDFIYFAIRKVLTATDAR